MTYVNSISIQSIYLPLLFASIKLTNPDQIGRWETEDEEDQTREYILPVGLKVTNAIAQLWLEYNSPEGIQSLEDTTYVNSITIEEANLPFLFACVVFAFPSRIGRWETQEEEDAVREFILPNGLKVVESIRAKWLDYNEIHWVDLR